MPAGRPKPTWERPNFHDAEGRSIQFDAIEEFLARDLITDVLGPLRPGKEAQVFVCQANPETGFELLAAKVYRPRAERGFRAEETYLEGRASLRRGRAAGSSVARAVARRSAAGKALLSELWVRREYEVLKRLGACGVPVPRPVACTEGAVLMEYLGDQDAPAPRLVTTHLSRDEAACMRETLLGAIARSLGEELIHGDLSAYNVLVHEGSPYLIDLPQAVDAAVHPEAQWLFSRDVTNLTRHFARYGITDDGAAWAQDVWHRYETGRL